MIRMMNDKIAVRQDRLPDTSPGGIYIGQQVDDGLVKELVAGEVVAVGPGKRLPSGERGSMWGLAPGQRISFSPVCSVRQVVNGEELTITSRDSVVGVEP